MLTKLLSINYHREQMDDVQQRTKKENLVFGDIWTIARAKGRLMSLSKSFIRYKKAERLEVTYLSKKEKIRLPKWFCKQCFYAWPARKEDPPEKCANYTGYIDKEGNRHEKCGSRHWDTWREDFDPKTCQSPIALSVWYDEQAEKEEQSGDDDAKVVNG